MNTFELQAKVGGLALLAAVATDNGVAALLRLCREPSPSAYTDYWRALAKADATDNATAYMREAILTCDFTVTEKTRSEFERELGILYELSRLSKADFPALEKVAAFLPDYTCGEAEPFDPNEILAERALSGTGVYRKSCAFRWDNETKTLVPILSLDPIRLSDLKSYETERAKVLDNTLCFLDGLPANNVLLYGDRGTGKSSTVKAILNELKSRNLKLIELSKSDIIDLPHITQGLPDNLRFILFIDDLAFESRSDDYASLKAALEGSVTRAANILIYATTNRRHLLKESHADRLGDDLHAGDTMEEQLSLSDRFGLTVTFMTPDKREFFEILQGILSDRHIAVEPERLSGIAERWALGKGGRSPRSARQLADVIESRFMRNLDLNDL